MQVLRERKRRGEVSGNGSMEGEKGGRGKSQSMKTINVTDGIDKHCALALSALRVVLLSASKAGALFAWAGLEPR